LAVTLYLPASSTVTFLISRAAKYCWPSLSTDNCLCVGGRERRLMRWWKDWRVDGNQPCVYRCSQRRWCCATIELKGLDQP
jgi:hypothetical protein